MRPRRVTLKYNILLFNFVNLKFANERQKYQLQLKKGGMLSCQGEEQLNLKFILNISWIAEESFYSSEINLAYFKIK